jgi:hypothetical protein
VTERIGLHRKLGGDRGASSERMTVATASKLHATATAAQVFCNEFGPECDQPTKPAIFGAANGLGNEVKKEPANRQRGWLTLLSAS